MQRLVTVLKQRLVTVVKQRLLTVVKQRLLTVVKQRLLTVVPPFLTVPLFLTVPPLYPVPATRLPGRPSELVPESSSENPLSELVSGTSSAPRFLSSQKWLDYKRVFSIPF